VRRAEEPIFPVSVAARENWRGRDVLDAGTAGAKWDVREIWNRVLKGRDRFPSLIANETFWLSPDNDF